MKNIIKYSALVLSVAGLASCSTLGLGGDENGVAQDQTAVATTTDVNVDADSTEVSDPTAKISLKKNDQDQVIATIYTNYNNNPQGSVKLQWNAPEGSKCYDTSFPITKYGEKNDKTWASVELKQGDKYCGGEWTANVVFDENVIASDSITA